MSKINKFVRDLMPDSTEEDISSAEESFRDYLLLIRQIVERLEREGKEVAVFEEEKTIES